MSGRWPVVVETNTQLEEETQFSRKWGHNVHRHQFLFPTGALKKQTVFSHDYLAINTILQECRLGERRGWEGGEERSSKVYATNILPPKLPPYPGPVDEFWTHCTIVPLSIQSQVPFPIILLCTFYFEFLFSKLDKGLRSLYTFSHHMHGSWP